MTVEIHAIIHGHVQGVGFRATTKQFANDLGLTGTVRNLPDHTVEIIAQGSDQKIQELFQALHQEFGTRHISKIEQCKAVLHQVHEGFVVVH